MATSTNAATQPTTAPIKPGGVVDLLDGIVLGGVASPVLQFNGLVPPVSTGSSAPGISAALTEWVLVLAGIVLVAIVYENDRKAGSLLLIIIVLLMLLAAQGRKLI